MSRVFVAKRSEDCAGCGTDVAGKRCRYHGRRLYHEHCAPSGSRRADAEYYRGIADVERWHEDIRLFGQETADALDLERELREDY